MSKISGTDATVLKSAILQIIHLDFYQNILSYPYDDSKHDCSGSFFRYKTKK